MASTYENDLRLEEMATGENSGSWGTKTNTNLELIADAFSYGTETIADADTSIEIQDGIADAARSLALKINSSADLTTTRTITLAPNTTSKVWIIENNTSGDQVLTISAGSGSNVTLPNGVTKIIATDGIGAGSNVTELYTNLHNITIDGTLTVDGILSLADGSNSAPSLTNTGDLNTGLYFPAADEVGLTVAGTQRLNVSATGIDVTGTILADGLTVDAGASDATITIDAGTAGVTSADAKLQLIGSFSGSGVAGYGNIYLDVPSGGKSDMYFQTALSGGSGGQVNRLKLDGNGDINFYATNGTTQAFHWDAADESLGIGDTTPESPITVKKDVTDASIVKAYSSASNSRVSYQIGNDADNWFMGIDGGNSDAFFIADVVSGSDRLVITQAGNVGIGGEPTVLGGQNYLSVHSPGTSTNIAGVDLYVSGTREASMISYPSNGESLRIAGLTNRSITFYTNNALSLTIDSLGSARLGESSPSTWASTVYDVLEIGNSIGVASVSGRRDGVNGANFGLNWHYETGATDTYIGSSFATKYTQASGNHYWYTAASGTAGNAISWDQAMTLDASGNLLVGKTVNDKTTDGIVLREAGEILVARSGDVATFNRKGSDGNIVYYQKDGSNVGSIGTYSNRIYIGTGDVGIFFDSATDDAIKPWNTSTNGARDASIDLGENNNRFKDLYLSGGVITGGGGTGNNGEIQFVADSTRARIVGGYDNGGGGYIAFRTDTTGGTDLERARFNNAGNLAFTSGNGLDFSAVTGGTGTATSNVLDDYEEGEWTPTLKGGTSAGTASYTARTGFYTKIGNIVQISMTIACTGITGTGNMIIDGLPFTTGTGSIDSVFSFQWNSMTWSGPIAEKQTIIPMLYQTSNTTIGFRASDYRSSYAHTQVQLIGSGNASYMRITGTYRVGTT